MKFLDTDPGINILDMIPTAQTTKYLTNKTTSN